MLRGNKLFPGLRALAMFTLILFAARAWAADQEKVLHSFGGGNDGYYPAADLNIDGAGNLYGTTEYGGIHCTENGGCGTVFELSPRQSGGWTETVLRSFGNGSDGSNPYGGSTALDLAGDLYGTTLDGGIHGDGTVFEITR